MTQTQTTVSSSSPPPANPPAAVSSQQQPPVDAAALQKQIDELRQSIGEKDRAIEFWQSKAATRPEPAEKAAPAAEEEDPDLLDVVTSKGVKGLEAILEKKGFVRKQEVEAMTNAKAEAFAKEQALLKEYPELNNKSSEFFKQAAQHYGHLIKQGVSPAVAMELSAERTALSFLREGKMQTPQQQKDEAKARREEERRARAQAQAGDRGVRTPAESEEEEDLSPEQKHIAAMMGISEEAYKARARKGVAMRGVR